MTTFAVREDEQLADAFTVAIARAGSDYDTVAALTGLRAAALPGNGHSGPASMPWHARGGVAAVLRDVAGTGHPAAAELESIAGALDDSVRWHVINDPGSGIVAPPRPPAPAPEPPAPAAEFALPGAA
jgi:hypothetical protein